ncbi:TrbI/VirB10 family protein [Novosphingobium mangrovi (ex Huang et al. 2023)]|uniref:Conjugal transfer protein TrbI n=1 Tax=Novosphingobium mangrovi (ex Huang et al. 2023) TaxID=2976432 RepID=A0ABT2IAK3_9SPHN|nr:TrbI/VirB10 family protein [Novosphingobium mangrovi (ex Huang et al. 2023)]MCT2401857.1 conjugal transfer protein TrbI [Novosphingobium mangrovi (ex Huang et al. 2023)]
MADPVPEPLPDPGDVRPLVTRATSGNRSVWIFAAILLAVGGGVFYGLQMRRLTMEQPSLLTPQVDAGAMIASPPELAIPAVPDYLVAGRQRPEERRVEQNAADQAPVRIPKPASYYEPPAVPPPVPQAYQPPAVPPGPGYAYQAPQLPHTGPGDASASRTSDGRVEARTFKNPGTTVPQGSVIQAVMETALDSTRPGFARAIVSRDVESFDGTRVLIPKGSRLFGDYQADVSLGQKRALIQWKRLTRPDGTIIDLDSPSADPLGRAGVKGKVNTHFFQRFGGAILQSILDVGVQTAARKAAGNTVIVGLPGATTQATTIQNPSDIKPTLKIAQGASVSVFVARDLDFTAVER